MTTMQLKKQLLEQCNLFVSTRLENIQKTINSNKKALQSETKSSAGDKHETGRAMLQLEMEKAGQQFASISEMKLTLEKINISKTSKNVCLGSLIKASNGNYFLATSVGKISIENENYFAISSHSPIGKLLFGKQQGDFIIWNSTKILITEIL